MLEVINAIAQAIQPMDIPLKPVFSAELGEQVIYNIVPLTDDGVKQANRMELKILANTLDKAIEIDMTIRKALLSIGDLKKNGVLDIELNGGGTMRSELGIHRLVNYTILQECDYR